MLGYKIFVHSVMMVLRNLKQALQITVIPAILAIVGILFLASSLIGIGDLGALVVGETPNPESLTGVWLFLAVSVAIYAFISFSVIVNWHRFVLLEEYPRGWWPTFKTNRILAYFGNVLLLSVLLLLIFAPVMILSFRLDGNWGKITLGIGALAMVYTTYRCAVVLPASAIGQPISIKEAWGSTSGATAAIIVLFLVSFVFQLVLQLVFFLIALVPVLGLILVLIPSMLILPLINVSILTTMYGVFVEKRSLD